MTACFSNPALPAGLARRWRGLYSNNFLAIVDYCLHLDPALRPAEAGVLLEALIEGKPAARPRPPRDEKK